MEQIPLGAAQTFHYIYDQRFKSESLSIRFYLPTIPEKNAGLYLLPSVLRDGCRCYPDEYSITRRLNQLFGADISHRISRLGNLTEIVFSLDCIDSQYTTNKNLFRDAIDLLYAIVYDPLQEKELFSEKYIAQEKELLLCELDELEHRYDEYARVLANRLIAEAGVWGHPLYGTKEEICSLCATDICDAYTRLMSAEMHLYYIGAKSAEEVQEIITEKHPRTQAMCPLTIEYPKRKECSQILEKAIKSEAEQSHVVLGYTFDITPRSQLFYCLSVFRELLSDAPTARLFRDVREATSICYACNASFQPTFGTMFLYAGVEPGNEDKVIRMMQETLFKIANGEICDAEILSAKKSALNRLKTMFDRRESREMWLSHQFMLGDKTDIAYHSTVIDAVDRRALISFAEHLSLASRVVITGNGGDACGN